MEIELVAALAVGAAAGAHTSTWGMYKDSPHEGFAWPKYFRSIVLAALVAVALAAFTGLDPTTASGAVVLFGVTYGIERALLELYKTFLREEDQSKYTIPMQFSVRGEVVESRAVRLGAGALYFAGELAVLAGIEWLEGARLGWSPWLTVFVVGSAGGWISAFGGAWKDAPIEGFHTLKFFRSPLLAFAWGAVIAGLTDEYLFIFIGAIGFTVATTETYKTFFFPSKPRGKFAEEPVRYPEMLERRKRFVPLYVAIWAAVAAGLAAAFAGGAPGGLL